MVQDLVFSIDGYMRHPLDYRELKYAKFVPTGVYADHALSLRLNPGRVEHQGVLNACVGSVVSSGAEMLINNAIQLSRRDAWDRAKVAMRTRGNVGVYLNVGCDMVLDGLPSEDDVPYDDQVIEHWTPDDVQRYDTALAHQLIIGDVVTGTIDALTAGHPVVFGFGVNIAAFTTALQKRGLLDKYSHNRSTYNLWHAMVAWGYEGSRGLVLCRNSWGMAADDSNGMLLPDMTAGDIAFTVDAFRDLVYEARELTPELVLPNDPRKAVVTLTEWTGGVGNWTQTPITTHEMTQSGWIGVEAPGNTTQFVRIDVPR